jgi:thymidylate synthase
MDTQDKTLKELREELLWVSSTEAERQKSRDESKAWEEWLKSEKELRSECGHGEQAYEVKGEVYLESEVKITK